jgi:transposase
VAAHNNSLVDVPDEKGVHVKTAGAKGEKYVYRYTEYFRNANGEPRNRAKAIGKYDAASGKMHPNSYYFEVYDAEPSLPEVSVWDYGYSYLVSKVCQDIGLTACLTEAFGKRAMDIIVMAAYMIREGNAMDGIDDWLQRNYFANYDSLLDSQSTSKVFGALAQSQIHDFFVGWVKVAMGEGSVCYDVTSISSYAQEMADVERGYNRDGDDLAQYNLGMFCNESDRMPLYYNRYNGSLTDKTNLAHVLSNAKAVGIKRIKMVLDGGFWDADCLSSLHDFCEAFTVGMPASLKESERLLVAYGGDIEKYENELGSEQVYCASVDADINGVPGRVMIFYDSWNHVRLCGELSERIDRLKAELASLKRYPKNKLSRYTPYFIITKHDNDSGFDYVADTGKVNKLRKNKGYFLIFTTDMDAAPADVLKHYRAKDAIEKIFAQIKVNMDCKRSRTHNEQTTDGKTFVTFIACVIRSYLLNSLAKYLTDNSTSLKKAFSQLSNIVIVSGRKGYRFAKAFTKKQKQILDAFNAIESIAASLR